MISYVLLWLLPLIEIPVYKQYRRWRSTRLQHELAQDKLDALAWQTWKRRFQAGTTTQLNLHRRRVVRTLSNLLNQYCAGELTSREYKYLRLDYIRKHWAATER